MGDGKKFCLKIEITSGYFIPSFEKCDAQARGHKDFSDDGLPPIAIVHYPFTQGGFDNFGQALWHKTKLTD